MAYYFRPFPLTFYDVKKNNKEVLLTNISMRFKVLEAFER